MEQLSFSGSLPDADLLTQYQDAMDALDVLAKKSLNQTRVFTDMSFELEMKGAEARKTARRWQRSLEDSIAQTRHTYSRKIAELKSLAKEKEMEDQQSTVSSYMQSTVHVHR